LQTLA